MGKRRIRLLKQHFSNLVIAGIDKREDRRNEIKQKYNCAVFDDFSTAVDDFCPDAVIISTCPESHNKFVIPSLNRGLHIFSELDLVSEGYETILNYEEQGSAVLFLSSTLLYRAENRWIIQNHKKTGFKNFYNYHVGQYLPDWHPWENYKDFFVYSRKTNALRELLCIEIPWLIRCFGGIIGYRFCWNKVSKLDIPFPDTYHLIIRHSSGTTGALTVDCVSRKATRELRIDGEKGIIYWNGEKKSLVFFPCDGNPVHPFLHHKKELKTEKGYDKIITEEPYLEELRLFLGEIESGNCKGEKYSYREHYDVLRLVDKIESEWSAS